MRNDVREDSPPRSLEVDVLTAMVSGLHESGCERDLVRTAADTLRSHGDCPSHRKLGSGKPHPQHQGQTYTASRSPMLQRSRTSVASDTASQNEPGSERKSAMIPVRRGEVGRPDRSQREDSRGVASGMWVWAWRTVRQRAQRPEGQPGLGGLGSCLERGRGTEFLLAQSLGVRLAPENASQKSTPRRAALLLFETNVGLGTACQPPTVSVRPGMPLSILPFGRRYHAECEI